jgi:hypothetical protein
MFAHLLAPAACLLVLMSAAAVTRGHSNAQFIRSWDQDGDARVSRAEYDDARAKRFATTDADDSGMVSQDEYINEYAIRLDEQIAGEKKASIEQTDTRFRSLGATRRRSSICWRISTAPKTRV